MRAVSEEVETPRERGNQEERGNCTDRNSDNGTRCTGRGAGRQSLTSDRNDRQGRYPRWNTVTAITGGILQQLIAEAKDDLAISEARVHQLRERVENLEALAAKLDDQ